MLGGGIGYVHCIDVGCCDDDEGEDEHGEAGHGDGVRLADPGDESPGLLLLALVPLAPLCRVLVGGNGEDLLFDLEDLILLGSGDRLLPLLRFALVLRRLL